MLQIQFLDKDVIKALIPVFSLKPEKVAFLFDRRMLLNYGLEHDNIGKAIWNRYPDIDIAFVEADMYKFEDIMDTLEALYETTDDEVTVDVAGGTELMVACGMMFCEKYNLTPTLCDMYKNRIIHAKTGERISSFEHLRLQDYMTALGAKHIKESHSVPKPEEFDSICNVAEYLFHNLDEWHALHIYLMNNIPDDDNENFEVPETVIYKNVNYDSEAALHVFEENGFVEKTGDGAYRFRKLRYKEYMKVFGVWLEMYIYIKGLSFFDESYLGYTIDWSGNDLEDTIDNEIDVIGMKNSVPVFISCKMRKVEAADAMEIAYLAGHFGGERAKGMVATTYRASEEKELPLGAYQRFKRLHVGMIETEFFATHTPAQTFNTAMQNTE